MIHSHGDAGGSVDATIRIMATTHDDVGDAGKGDVVESGTIDSGSVAVMVAKGFVTQRLVLLCKRSHHVLFGLLE